MTLVMMMISIGADLPNVEASTPASTPVLGYYWGCTDEEGNWYANTTTELMTELNGVMIYTGSPVFFCFTDANGVETGLTASDLDTSDEQIVSIRENTSAPGMVELEFSKLGTAAISYDYEGMTYSVSVSVILPPVGVYSSSIAEEDYFSREYTITDNNNTFYLVGRDDYKITDVTLDGRLGEIAYCSIDETGKFAAVTVTGTPENMYYNVDFTASSEQYQCEENGCWGVWLTDGRPGLKYRWGDWENDTLIENTEYNLEHFWKTARDSGTEVFVYYVDENGETLLTADQLESSDPSVVTVSQSEVNASAVRLDAVGFGQASICCTVGGTTYQLQVLSELPEIGFYTSPEAGEDTYLSEFLLTDTNDTFYFVGRDGWEITELELDGDFAEIAKAELDTEHGYATIRITGQPQDGYWYGVRYNARNAEEESFRNDCSESLRITDKRPDLKFRWGDWEDDNYIDNPQNEFCSFWATSSGYSSEFFIYYVDENGETLLTADRLESSDPSVVTVSPSEVNASAVRLDAVGFGEAAVCYTVGGTTYQLEVLSELPKVGFYAAPEASRDTHLSEFIFTDAKDTFYLVDRDGWEITELELDGDFAEIAEAKLDPEHGYAAIRITGQPQDGCWYDVRCQVQDPNDNSITEEYISLLITDRRPGLKFRWGDWENDTLIENTEYNLEHFWKTARDSGTEVFVYYVDENGETLLTADQLESSDPSVVTVSQSEVNASAVRLDAVGFGEAAICCTVGGTTYQLQVLSELPDVGFYTSPEASQDTYITSFSVNDTENVFYLAGSNGWKLLSVKLSDDFENVADISFDPDNGYAVITVTGEPLNMNYDLEFTAENREDHAIREEMTSIFLMKRELFYYEYEDSDLLITWDDRINSEIHYWDSEIGEVSADVIDVQITGGDRNAVEIIKGTEEDEVFWQIYAKETGAAEVTITHTDPEDAGNTISFTYTINVIDKALVYQHEMLTTAKNWAVPGDVSIKQLSVSVFYYDYEKQCLEEVDVTDSANFDWSIAALHGSAHSGIVFRDNTVTVTVAADEMPGSFFAYECEVSYEIDGETLYAYMFDFVETCESYYYVTSTDLPSDFTYGNTAAVTPVIKQVTYDYTDRVRNETIAKDNIYLVWYKDIEELSIYCNGVEVPYEQEMKYDPTDVFTVKRGAFWDASDFAFVVDVLYEDENMGDFIDYYVWTLNGTTCPHPADKVIWVDAKDASCTTEGDTGDTVCTVCGKILKESEKIPATGHTYTSSVKSATCTEAGEKVYTCACGDTYTVVLEPVGHIYSAGTCTVCKAADPDYRPATEVEIVEKQEVQQAADEVKQDIVGTISDAIKEAKENAEASGEAIPAEKLVEIVKEALTESNDTEVKAVVSSVSEETLEKVITAIEEDKEIVVTVVVRMISEENIKEIEKEDVAKIENLAGDRGIVAQYLDLSVLIQAEDENGNVETLGTVNESTREFAFTLFIPENLQKDGRIFYIIRVHDNGDAERIDVKDNGDGTVSFVTDKFSTYALAYSDARSPQTGNDSYLWIFLMLAICGVVLTGACAVKRRLYHGENR